MPRSRALCSRLWNSADCVMSSGSSPSAISFRCIVRSSGRLCAGAETHYNSAFQPDTTDAHPTPARRRRGAIDDLRTAHVHRNARTAWPISMLASATRPRRSSRSTAFSAWGSGPISMAAPATSWSTCSRGKTRPRVTLAGQRSRPTPSGSRRGSASEAGGPLVARLTSDMLIPTDYSPTSSM